MFKIFVFLFILSTISAQIDDEILKILDNMKDFEEYQPPEDEEDMFEENQKWVKFIFIFKLFKNDY